ncbi:hypothetical protein ACRAKI_17370 [Saccharothrix isguenensis]
MADDERLTRVPEVDVSEQEERLADSQRKIDEAKVAAADLAKTAPDPSPDTDPPEGASPAS